MESSINAPHADDPNPDDFFDPAPEAGAEPEAGDPAASGGTAAAEQPPAEPEPAPAEPDAPAPEPEAPAEPEPAPGEAELPPPADPPASPGDGNGGDGGGKASGAPTRNYEILREITLTVDALKALLKEAEETVGGEFRKAFFHLETLEARNVKHALSNAFNNHNETIGQSPRLAAVPERAWSVKTVSPKQRTVESLDIS